MTVGNPSYSSPDYLTDVDVNVFYRCYYYNTQLFNDRLNQRYQELRQTGKPFSTDCLVDRVGYYYHLLKKSGAADRETRKWSRDSDLRGETIDFDSEYLYICNWIAQHMQLLDQLTLPVIYTQDYFETIGITQPLREESNPASSSVYSISGQQTQQNSRLKPGIYIQKGKKIIIRR